MSQKLGTEYTPQWMKIPNLPSSNHSGVGWFSSDSQVGSKFIRGGSSGVVDGGVDMARAAAANSVQRSVIG